MSENVHELAEVYPIAEAVTLEERVNDTFAQRIDRELRNTQEVITTQGAAVPAIQWREPGVEAFDLVVGDCNEEKWV